MAGKQCNATAIGPIFARGDQKEFHYRIVCKRARGQQWLALLSRKVLRVFNKNEKNDDDDDDEGQSDQKAPKYVVKNHEYIQTEINEQPTGKYQLHFEHG